MKNFFTICVLALFSLNAYSQNYYDKVIKKDCDSTKNELKKEIRSSISTLIANNSDCKKVEGSIFAFNKIKPPPEIVCEIGIC
ncbi:MAG: hypothetical protein ACOCWM_01465 [Cyclobacteriaceae bacterium]